MYLHLALQKVLLRKRALTSSVALQIVQILKRHILYKNKLIIGLGLPELDTIKIGAEGEFYQEVSNRVSNGTGRCNFSGHRDKENVLVPGQRDNGTSSKSCHGTGRDFKQAVPGRPGTLSD